MLELARRMHASTSLLGMKVKVVGQIETLQRYLQTPDSHAIRQNVLPWKLDASHPVDEREALAHLAQRAEHCL